MGPCSCQRHTEDLLEERMMNMVTLIADHVQTKQELFSNEGKIMDSLMSSGYHLQEADAVVTLMQSLAGNAASPRPTPGLRTMTTQERSRFTLEAFSLVVKLAALGIIDEDQREDVVEKALSLHQGKIDLASVKTLLAVNLFGDPAEYKELASAAENRRGATWN